MKKLLWIILLAAASAAYPEVNGYPGGVKQQPYAGAAPEENWSLAVYYQYDRVDINSRNGAWQENTLNFMYIKNPALKPYIEVSRLTRFDKSDYTFKAGAYWKFPRSYLWLEAGVGEAVEFSYDFEAAAEYQHVLKGTTFWKLAARYLDYNTTGTGSVWIIKPGLIRYFGNNYVSADYAGSFTQGRGYGQWAALKGDFYLTGATDLEIGGAYGTRIYDVDPLLENTPVGYIVYANLKHRFSKNLTFKIGYTIAGESSYFKLNGPDAALIFRF